MRSRPQRTIPLGVCVPAAFVPRSGGRTPTLDWPEQVASTTGQFEDKRQLSPLWSKPVNSTYSSSRTHLQEPVR